jgi:hypothetical protein
MSIKFVLKRKLTSSIPTNNSIIAEYSFDGNLFTIGSDSGNNLVIEKSAFEQAVIVREGAKITLINSADGTKLNGELLRREAIEQLSVNDELEIANHLIAIVDSDQSPDETAPEDVFTTNEDEIIDVYATTKFNTSEIADVQIETPTVRAAQSPAAEAKPQNNPPLEQPENTPRNFAAVLDALRTEDDSFYFTVKSGEQEVKRIALDQPETPLGTSANGELVAEEIATLCAVARKDWSGILIEAPKAGSIAVNGEKIAATRRLRHDDAVVLTYAPKFSLVLHEPSSLVALESLLSARSDANSRFGNLGANNGNSTAVEPIPAEPAKKSFLERRYFKHFSFVEFISMIIGTLIGAVIVFLLLELIFS